VVVLDWQPAIRVIRTEADFRVYNAAQPATGRVLMLNGRSVSLIARGAMQPSNYLALARMGRLYERPMQAASQYFLGRGQYPCSIRVRTPCGPQEITLFTSQDAMTVHEIFCRQVYRSLPAPEVVVDLGSNIGISALYFLTRSPSTYCDLYEPDPRNIERLLRNLRGFASRFTIRQTAVWDKEGMLTLIREPTGRYGSLKDNTWLGMNPDKRVETDRIDVQVEHVNAVLDRTLSERGRVDLLKIDTEGCEVDTLRAIDPSLLARIRHIVIEDSSGGLQLDDFDTVPSWDTTAFRNKRLVA
jgi:FkbM family methyltransferase